MANMAQCNSGTTVRLLAIGWLALLSSAYVNATGAQELIPNFKSLSPNFESFRSTRAPLPDQARELDETTIQFIDVDYRGGPYARGFLDLVNEYGARSPKAVNGPIELTKLVERACTDKDRQTVDLFDVALDEAGLVRRTATQTIVESASGSIPVPPCLPTLPLDVVMRVVLPGDRVEDFWKVDQSCSDCVTMRWADSDQSIPREIHLLNESTASILEEEEAGPQAELTAIIEQTQPDELTQQHTAGKYSIASENRAYASDSEFAAALFEDLALAILTGTPEDRALDIITAEVQTLRPASAKRIEAGLRGVAAKFLHDQSTRLANVVRISGLYGAMQQYRPSRFDGSSLAYGETVVVLQSDLTVKPATTALTPGDIVLSLIARSSTGRIPIDLTTVARKKGLLPDDPSGLSKDDIKAALMQAGAQFDEQLRLNPPTVGQTQLSSLTPDTTVLFTDVSANGCATPTAGEDSMFKGLPDAALRARLAMAAQGIEPQPVAVVVADSGYQSEPGAPTNPFRYAVDSVFDAGQDSPLDDFDQLTLNHGTAVTGVAVGGPIAWPLSAALGLPISTRPIRIYVKDPFGTIGRFVPDVRRIRGALNGPPNIVNLSIGERKGALGRSGSIEDALSAFLDDDGGPLFVVAAGNNGANDNPDGGMDVVQIELYPQVTGAFAKNNVLVVGSTDGETPAKFSNFSKDAVSILAPGCGVGSWQAESAARTYVAAAFTGTSFSAPLVTYVAGLVYSLTPQDFRSAGRIKARILASSDLRPELVDAAADGRLLNPAKAVSLYNDVVELETVVNGVNQATTMYGQFRDQDVRLGRFCQTNFVEGGTLLKVAKTPQTNDGDLLLYYTWSENVGLKRGICEPREFISFTREGATTSERLPIAKLLDVVFKWRKE